MACLEIQVRANHRLLIIGVSSSHTETANRLPINLILFSQLVTVGDSIEQLIYNVCRVCVCAFPYNCSIVVLVI